MPLLLYPHTQTNPEPYTTAERQWFMMISLSFLFFLYPVTNHKILLEENYCCEIMESYLTVTQDWPSHDALVYIKWCYDLTKGWFHTLFCFVGLWFLILASQWSPIYVISPTCSIETISREKRFQQCTDKYIILNKQRHILYAYERLPGICDKDTL